MADKDMSGERFDTYYRKDWMDDDQWASACFLAELLGGFHHVHGHFNDAYQGVQINLQCEGNKFATYDFNLLTRAVVKAHDECFRFAIEPSGPQMLRIVITKRHTREGGMAARHPTLEDHVSYIRGVQPPTRKGNIMTETARPNISTALHGMKISKRALGDLAAQIVHHALEGGFSRVDEIELAEIEKVELAAHIKRSIALGVNRVVFDITENDQTEATTGEARCGIIASEALQGKATS